eukprot:6173818-Pleurochrysis_carterae.AAC.3
MMPMCIVVVHGGRSDYCKSLLPRRTPRRQQGHRAPQHRRPPMMRFPGTHPRPQRMLREKGLHVTKWKCTAPTILIIAGSRPEACRLVPLSEKMGTATRLLGLPFPSPPRARE